MELSTAAADTICACFSSASPRNRRTVSRTPRYSTPWASTPSMRRVLMTSRGVVTAAAMPPEIDPQSAASYDCIRRSGKNVLAKIFYEGVKKVGLGIIITVPHFSWEELLTFNHSYKGNCTNEKGISRKIVLPNPR